jgi:RND family efflux transporter MFP subunit
MNPIQDSPDLQPGTHPLSRAVIRSGVAILVVGAVALTGIVVMQHRALARQAEARRKATAAGPLVKTLLIGSPGTLGEQVFQGEALPYLSTTLYARASGFLKEIRVDKGSVVKKGQILAVIESQETDQDLAALRADAENKRRNAERAANLLRDKLISARDAEQAAADAKVAESKLASLGISKGYQQIRAPFDGVVTQRFADPGALVQNASGSTSAQPVVTVSQVDRLRVTLYLDQAAAAKAKPGDPVLVTSTTTPIQKRPGRLSRLAGALDPRTRTLTAEADLDNRDGAFLPGGSVRVTLGKPGSSGFTLPLECVTQRQGKPFALVVDAASHTHLRPLTLGEDNGQRVRLLQGLQAGERVVLNPPPGLMEGSLVRVADAGQGPMGGK